MTGGTGFHESASKKLLTLIIAEESLAILHLDVGICTTLFPQTTSLTCITNQICEATSSGATKKPDIDKTSHREKKKKKKKERKRNMYLPNLVSFPTKVAYEMCP